MASTNEIKHHIDAVMQTRKITGAMQLVSSARLRKARKNAYYNASHFAAIRSSMKDVLLSPHEITSDYLNLKQDGHRIYIVIAADKGMAGSYNADVLKFAVEELSHHANAVVTSVGFVAADYLKKHGYTPVEEVSGMVVPPTLSKARYLSELTIDAFKTGEIHSVHVIYTEFKQGGSPKPQVKRMLPILVEDYDDIEPSKYCGKIQYFPSVSAVLDNIVPQYLASLYFDILSQSYAAEHFCRMNAMQSATDNADQLLQKLERQYNSARQSAITQEISEISGAAKLLVRGNNQ